MHPMNFGTVIYNPVYQIYRSAELGKLGLKQLKKTLEEEGKIFPRTIIYMNAEGYAFPLYFAIEEFKGQKEYGYSFFHPFQVHFGNSPRTYIDGQNPYEPTDIIDSWKYYGIMASRYSPAIEKGNGKITGGIENVIEVLNIILAQKYQPVLFHCLGGFHRTGMIAMLLRKMQGWNNEQIVSEYGKYNPIFYRPKNVEFIMRFSQSEEFTKLKEQFERNMNGIAV